MKKLLNVLLSFCMAFGVVGAITAMPLTTSKDDPITASAVTAIAPREVDGVWQIGQAGELLWFAQHVNSGNYTANAALTADIDMTGVYTWEPIGIVDAFNFDVENPPKPGFAGTFDGNGHVIKNLTLDSEVTYPTSGLFGTVSGTVKELGMDNYRYTKLVDSLDGRFGAIAGQVILNGTITDCYVVNSTVDGGTKVAGIIAGCNYGGTIENCFTYGCTVQGSTRNGQERFGYIVGDNINDSGMEPIIPGTVINCYTDGHRVASTQSEGETGCEASVSDEDFASGKIAHALGASRADSPWGQTLDVDGLPVFSAATVYCYDIRYCYGAFYAVYYSNTAGEEVGQHHPSYNVSDGKCTGCSDQKGLSVVIGDQPTFFDDFTQEAVDLVKTGTAESPATIKLYTDLVTEANININSGYSVLELNGCAFTHKGFSVLDATLTIKDSSEAQTGKICNVGSSLTSYAFASNSWGSIILESGTIEGSVDTQKTGTVIQNGGTINGDVYLRGTYVLNDGALNGTINNQTEFEAVEIHGGRITSDSFISGRGYSYTPVITITGGVFVGTDPSAVVITIGSGTTLDISGGTFESGISSSRGLAELLADGYVYYNESGEYIALTEGQTAIEGKVTVGACAHAYTYTSTETEHTGACTRCGAVKAAEAHTYDVEDGKCVCGVQSGLSVTVGGVATFFNAFTQEVVDLAKTGTEESPAAIKFYTDVTADFIIQYNAGSAVLDLNGRTFTYTNFLVSRTLVIEDNSEAQTGKLLSGSGDVFTVAANGYVTFSGGTIEGTTATSAVDVRSSGTFVQNGGTINATISLSGNYTLNDGILNGGIICQNSFIRIEIHGGWITANRFVRNSVHDSVVVVITGGFFTRTSTEKSFDINSDTALDISGGTFEKGLSTSQTLAAHLADGYAFHDTNGAPVALTEDQVNISEWVTVALCAHEGVDKYGTQNEDGATHNEYCGACNSALAENVSCAGGEANCMEKATCATCGGTYGELASDNHLPDESKWEKEDSGHYRVCVRCGVKLDGSVANHKVVEDSLKLSYRESLLFVTIAYYLKYSYTCEVCGQVEVELPGYEQANELGTKEHHELETPATCSTFASYTVIKWVTIVGEQTALIYLLPGEEYDDNNHDRVTSCTSNGDGTHTVVCECGGTADVACWGRTATCVERASCMVCGGEYGELAANDHSGADKYLFNNDGTHTVVCKCGKYLDVYEGCSGGTAYCKQKANCAFCQGEYGDFDENNHLPDESKYEGAGEGHYHPCALCGVKIESSLEAHNFVADGWKTSYREEISGIGILYLLDYSYTCENCGPWSTNMGITVYADQFNEWIEMGMCQIQTPATCSTPAIYAVTMKIELDEKVLTWELPGVEYDASNHSGGNSYKSNGKGSHSPVCQCGEILEGSEACSGGEATCTQKATCAFCGGEYGSKDYTNHANGNVGYDVFDGKHRKRCWDCSMYVEAAEPCTGGEATCNQKAICEVCGGEYGDYCHVPAEDKWTADWMMHYSVCSLCDVKLEALSGYHKAVEGSVKTRCEESAEYSEFYGELTYALTYVYTCEVCGEREETLGVTFASDVGKEEYGFSLKTSATCTSVAIYTTTINVSVGNDIMDLTWTVPGATYDESKHTAGAEATCTTAQTCTECNAELAPAKGHTAGAEATCTTAQTCTECNAELAPAKGHTAGAEATCTTAQTCTECNAELAPAKGHTAGAAATCTTAQTCTECNAELAPAKGHTAGEAATCTTAQTCTECNAELAPAKGHTAGAEATCTTAQTCTECNAELAPAKGHTESGWIVDTPADEGVAGKQHKECTVCGEQLKTAELPALPETKRGCFSNVLEGGKLYALVLGLGAVAVTMSRNKTKDDTLGE